MKHSTATSPMTGQSAEPRVFSLSKKPEAFNRMLDRYRASALLGYIHQRKFHLTVIKALDEIELNCSPEAFYPSTGRRRCSSCGAQLMHPPLCTRCLLHL